MWLWSWNWKCWSLLFLTASGFILHVINYFKTLNFIQGITSDLLVNWSSDYDYDTNRLIISATLKYIKESGRFE